MTLAVDNYNSLFGNNVTNVTIDQFSTAQPEIWILSIGLAGSGHSIAEITDTLNLAWTLLVQQNSNAPSQSVWTAQVSSIVPQSSPDAITLTASATISNFNVEIVGISGVPTSSYFDEVLSTGQTGTTAHGSNSIPTISGITTANANDIIIALMKQGGNLTQTAGAGFSLAGTNPNSSSGAIEYEIVSSTQSSISVPFGTASGSGNSWSMAVMALKQAAGPPTKQPDTYSSINAVNNYLAATTDPLITNVRSSWQSATPPYFKTLANAGQQNRLADVYSPIGIIVDALALEALKQPSKLYSQPPLLPTLPPVDERYGFPGVYPSLPVKLPFILGSVAITSSFALFLVPGIQKLFPVEILGYMQSSATVAPTSLFVPPPPTQQATVILPQGSRNFIEVTGALNDAFNQQPKKLTLDPPFPSAGYFSAYAGLYRENPAVLAYLLDLQTKQPTALTVGAPVFAILPPIIIGTPPTYVPGIDNLFPDEIKGFMLIDALTYPRHLTVDPPFVIPRSDVGTQLNADVYGFRTEIQDYLRDLQPEYPRSLTVNPVNTANLVAPILPQFIFTLKPEIMAYIEELKKQQPRYPYSASFTDEFTSLIQNVPFTIGSVSVKKGSSNLYVLKGASATNVDVV